MKLGKLLLVPALAAFSCLSAQSITPIPLAGASVQASLLPEDGARDVARAQFTDCKVITSKLVEHKHQSVWKVLVEEQAGRGSIHSKAREKYSLVEIDALSQKVLSVKHHVPKNSMH
jgi:hypothetical protein